MSAKQIHISIPCWNIPFFPPRLTMSQALHQSGLYGRDKTSQSKICSESHFHFVIADYLMLHSIICFLLYFVVLINSNISGSNLIMELCIYGISHLFPRIYCRLSTVVLIIIKCPLSAEQAADSSSELCLLHVVTSCQHRRCSMSSVLAAQHWILEVCFCSTGTSFTHCVNIYLTWGQHRYDHIYLNQY